MAMAAQFPRVDFQPNLEHEQRQTDLAQDLQDIQAGRWKQHLGDSRRDPPEQRRAEQDSGCHFPHHLGLPDLAEHDSHGPRREQDYRNLQEEDEDS